MEVALGSIDEQKKRSSGCRSLKKRSSTFRGRENGPPLSNFLGTPLTYTMGHIFDLSDSKRHCDRCHERR
jgi:hypothetical protein